MTRRLVKARQHNRAARPKQAGRAGCALALILATLFSIKPLPASAEAVEIPPFTMVRSLQFIQDSVVLGDHSAGEMQRHLLALIDERLRSADASDFEDRRNVDAVLVYTMSGGNPETLARLMRGEARTAFDSELAEGLTVYFSGKPEKARPQLKRALRQFEGSPIESYLTLVTANVTAARDIEAALHLFDRARLLAPGTIIEESALRRSAHVASLDGRVERAMKYSERYVRRFLNSPYASQFVDVFVHMVVSHSDKVDASQMEYILSLMDVARQREIYLRMARMSTIAGKEDLALLAAGRAEALSGNKRDVVQKLAKFYAGVASVSTENLDEAIDAVASMPEGNLSDRDKALRDAARIIAEEVTREPSPIEDLMPEKAMMPAPTVETADEGTTSTSGEKEELPDPLQDFLSARKATLAEVDRLLEGEGDER